MQDPVRGPLARAGARKPRNGVFSVAAPPSISQGVARLRATLRDAFSSMENKDLLEVAVHRVALIPKECHALGPAAVTAAAVECLAGFSDSKGPAKKERCRLLVAIAREHGVTLAPVVPKLIRTLVKVMDESLEAVATEIAWALGMLVPSVLLPSMVDNAEAGECSDANGETSGLALGRSVLDPVADAVVGAAGTSTAAARAATACMAAAVTVEKVRESLDPGHKDHDARVGTRLGARLTGDVGRFSARLARHMETRAATLATEEEEFQREGSSLARVTQHDSLAEGDILMPAISACHLLWEVEGDPGPALGPTLDLIVALLGPGADRRCAGSGDTSWAVRLKAVQALERLALISGQFGGGAAVVGEAWGEQVMVALLRRRHDRSVKVREGVRYSLDAWRTLLGKEVSQRIEEEIHNAESAPSRRASPEREHAFPVQTAPSSHTGPSRHVRRTLYANGGQPRASTSVMSGASQKKLAERKRFVRPVLAKDTDIDVKGGGMVQIFVPGVQGRPLDPERNEADEALWENIPVSHSDEGLPETDITRIRAAGVDHGPMFEVEGPFSTFEEAARAGKVSPRRSSKFRPVTKNRSPVRGPLSAPMQGVDPPYATTSPSRQRRREILPPQVVEPSLKIPISATSPPRKVLSMYGAIVDQESAQQLIEEWESKNNKPSPRSEGEQLSSYFEEVEEEVDFGFEEELEKATQDTLQELETKAQDVSRSIAAGSDSASKSARRSNVAPEDLKHLRQKPVPDSESDALKKLEAAHLRGIAKKHCDWEKNAIAALKEAFLKEMELTRRAAEKAIATEGAQRKKRLEDAMVSFSDPSKSAQLADLLRLDPEDGAERPAEDESDRNMLGDVEKVWALHAQKRLEAQAQESLARITEGYKTTVSGLRARLDADILQLRAEAERAVSRDSVDFRENCLPRIVAALRGGETDAGALLDEQEHSLHNSPMLKAEISLGLVEGESREQVLGVKQDIVDRHEHSISPDVHHSSTEPGMQGVAWEIPSKGAAHENEGVANATGGEEELAATLTVQPNLREDLEEHEKSSPTISEYEEDLLGMTSAPHSPAKPPHRDIEASEGVERVMEKAEQNSLSPASSAFLADAERLRRELAEIRSLAHARMSSSNSSTPRSISRSGGRSAGPLDTPP